MSAFVMEKEFFNQLASEVYMRVVSSDGWRYRAFEKFFGVNRRELCETIEERIRAKCQLLYNANIEAVNGRYNADMQSETIDFYYRIAEMSDVQLYKHIQCLHYQMTEEPVCNSAIFKAFSEMLDGFAGVIISELPEYKAAAWDFERSVTHSVKSL